MTRNQGTKGSGAGHTPAEGLNRRDVFKAGAAAGAGAAALAGPAVVGAPAAAAEAEVTWDYEADVVIAGAGCAGLTAAIRARDAGVSVLVIDQNFDVGGRMLHSGGYLSLGGGDATQIRDMEGRADDEGFITVDPLQSPDELDDSVELLFADVCDGSVLDRRAQTPTATTNAT